jgi:maltose alpha-D-glucosyltransferase/alpha-amylase
LGRLHGDPEPRPGGAHHAVRLRNNWVLFVHNLDAKPREITFSVGLEKENAGQGKLLVNLLGEEHSRADKDGKHRLVIEAYGYRWFRVGGLDYLLRRSDIDQPES